MTQANQSKNRFEEINVTKHYASSGPISAKRANG